MPTARRTSTRALTRIGAVAGVAGLLTLGLAGPASAHVTVTPSTTAAGSYSVLTFSVGHGCEGSPTTAVTISIPEGINAATPTRNDYYDVTKQVAKLDPAVTDAEGNELTERVSTVTYTAKTPLPDGYRDTFEVQLQLPEDAEGETLSFPTIQTCAQGETAWTEIAEAGQSEDDLDNPAPAFAVTEASEGGHHDAGATHDDAAEEGEEGEAAAVSTETGSAAETQESAASSDDDGNGLAIAGLVAGVAGLLVGGFALLRSRRTA
ncbi:YcnI family protein [Nocardioides sp.]|uniref:YcnI family copper-binding membrane protein n=1 Tax=Nocardioides sp. TaxID=35761 RepID=UPI00271F1B64|nr:YcnI family protein [Nocardioides sp.]MDO9455882.1 YcnI family protein [Nocardioides sp.]